MNFYGIDVSKLGGHNPPTVQEILTLPVWSQKWTLEQLTAWVYDHSGDQDELFDAAGGDLAVGSIINASWNAAAAKSPPNFTRKGAQIFWGTEDIAIQMCVLTQRMRQFGQEPDNYTVAVAQAIPRSQFDYDTVGDSVWVIFDR